MEPSKQPNEHDLKSYFTDDKQQYIFHFQINTEQLPTKVDVPLKASTILEDALLEAIGHANEKIATLQLSLKPDITLYKVRLPGKNFLPKTDLPALSLFQKVCDLKVEEFAVQILDKQKAIIQLQANTETSSKGNAVSEQKQVASKLQNLQVKEKPQAAGSVQHSKPA